MTPATRRRAQRPDTQSKIGQARAWASTQADEWTRGKLANAMNLAKRDLDWIMSTLRNEGSIAQSGLRGWWRTVRRESEVA